MRAELKKRTPEKQIDYLNAVAFDVLAAKSAEMEAFILSGIQKAKTLNKLEAEADLYNQLSICYAYMGKHDMRLSYNLKAIRIFEKLRNSSKVGKTYTNLGYSLKSKDSKKSKEYMNKGIKLLEKEKDFVTLNAAYDNYGVVQEMTGNIDSAIFFYNKALKLKRNQNDSIGIPYALGHLSSAYNSKQNYSQAKEFLDEAFAIRKFRKDANGIAESLVLYAEFYYSQNNYSEALNWFLKSYNEAKKINYVQLAQYAADFASKCYEKLGDSKNAIVYLKIQHALQDSLINESTNKSIAELEIQFETEKKEKQLAQQKEIIAKQALRDKQRNYILTGLSALLLIFIFLGRYIYKLQKFKQQKLQEENLLKDEMSKIRLENELHEERTRISKDLHDNIGSQLTFIISSVDNMSYHFKSGDEKLKEKLEGVSNFSKTTISQLRDTVWALNQDEISFEDLKTRLQNHLLMANTAQQLIDLQFIVEVKKNIHFNAVQGVNIYRIVQEALNNALKHSEASKVNIQFKEIDEFLELSIEDNGIGFDQSKIIAGNGLENMGNRASAMEASFKLYTKPNQGTKIIVFIPLNKAIDV